jgi:hypothetical protein
MTAAKAKKTSPLAEFFSNATDQRKRDVYTLVISKATASQLRVEEKAREITKASRQEKASA